MKEKNYTGIIPEQQTGKAIDAESSVELNNIEEAKTFFNVVKSRLQNVNKWHKFAGDISAVFKLLDKESVEVQRSAQKGDYIKIDIPGPGSDSGDGYDWVQIEEVESTSVPDVDSFAFRVRPAQNPQNNKDDTAHFFSPESTSSFTVTREKKKVTAAIYDRNTKANKEVDSITDKIRDAVVGTAGIIGFSKIQWKNLTDGLLSRENNNT
ncbi:MAG: hypothetical protein H0V14_07705 [Chitinophagaceae bacterium]|nr:hypothetical protein [Chitinophagaceae bacterium]